MLSPDDAKIEASAEAQELALEESWKEAFAGAAPTAAVLVRNLSPRGRDYFIVDFRKGTKSTGRMIVNLDTGIVDVVTGIEAPGEELPEFIAPSDVRSRITQDVQLDDGRVIHLPTTPPNIQVLWQHSKESQTMFLPFYWASWGTTGVFMRSDGKFFDQLTPTDGMPRRKA